MEIVPIYPDIPRAPVEDDKALAINHDCQRCPLAKGARHVCMKPEPIAPPGSTGDVALFVGDYPGDREDRVGKPQQGTSGTILRALVKKYWGGRVVFDNAIKCAPTIHETGEKAVDQCRGYLTRTILEFEPKRIIAMGQWAIYALTGRVLPPFSVRRGYSWLSSMLDQPTPVALLMNPAAAARNRFVRGWFEEDLKHALLGEVPFAPPWNGVARVVRTLDDALEAERVARNAPWISFDTETAGRMFDPFQVVVFSFAIPDCNDAWTWDVDSLKSPELRAVLQRILSDPTIQKVGQNLKYDQNSCYLELGKEVNGTRGDSRLIRRLLDPDTEANLEVMAELVGMGGHKEEAQQALAVAIDRVRHIAKENASGQTSLFKDYNGVRPDVVKSIRPGCDPEQFAYGFLERKLNIRYNARDSVSTARLETLMEKRLEADAPSLSRVHRQVIVPAADAIRQVEAWGIGVSTEAIKAFAVRLSLQKDILRSKLFAYGKFDPDSPKAVGDFLFGRLGLAAVKQLSSGHNSTDEEALDAIKHQHPIVPDIIEWRRLQKLDSSYATGMLRHICQDGRIHPHILLDGARSGRMSCKNPNMQTLPREADDEGNTEGKMARDCFCAADGWTIVSADYSQIELRVAAMLSGDPVMIELFRSGVDFHQATAEFIAPIVWHINASQVQKPHRSGAKAFNFGILYGMSDEGIAERAHCSVAEAEAIRNAILGKYKVLARWINERLSYSKRTGVCWTWWDGEDARRRQLWKLADQDGESRSKAEHGAWNTPVQGTASEFLTASIGAVVKWFKEDDVPAKVVLPVHDSMVMEVRNDVVEEVCWTVNSIMTGWNSLGVPIVVDIDKGQSYGSMSRVAL